MRHDDLQHNKNNIIIYNNTKKQNNNKNIFKRKKNITYAYLNQKYTYVYLN